MDQIYFSSRWCVMIALLALFPSSALCWGGSMFAVPEANSGYGNSNSNYNNALARSSRSLFPRYFPQPPSGFGNTNNNNFAGSSGGASSNSFESSFNNLVPADGSAVSMPKQTFSPFRSSPSPWNSQNFWWSNNVPAVSSAVRKSLDSADSPTYSSSSNDNSNNNNQYRYSASFGAPPAPAYGSPSPQSFPEQPQPTQEPSTTYSPSTTTSVDTTPPAQESTSAFSQPSSTPNAYFSSFFPGQPQQQQQPEQPRSEPSYSQSPFRDRINKKLDRVLGGRQGDYNSLFSSFDSVPGFRSTPWTSAPTAPTQTASNSQSYNSAAPKYVVPSAPPTSPTNQQTTAGSINSTQTNFQQGGHLVTYTTKKKKFLKTTISRHSAKADFQRIFEDIGDPALAPGEYMDGPFKRQSGAEAANPALSMTQQDPLNWPQLQQALVDKHNVLRASVQPPPANMMKMVWNEAAAKKAAEWTAVCDFAHDPHESRRSDHFKCGQNLARGVPDPVSWDTVIQLWFEEKNYFEMNKEPKGVVGHYTQLVWAQSFELGCAHHACKGWHYYVCNYCPVGNVKSRKYEPYKTGDKCSMCPGSCDENGLCTNYCMHANDYGNCDELEQTNNICMRPDLSPKCKATCSCKSSGKLY